MDEAPEPLPPKLPPPLPADAFVIDNEEVGGESEPAGPWGFWATTGFCFVIAMAGLLAQIVAAVPIVITQGQEQTGFMLAVATIVSTPVVVALCLLFAKLRRGLPIAEYLGWLWPGKRRIVIWSVGLIVAIPVADMVSRLFDRPVVPDVMVDIYETAGFLPLLWLAIIVAAPIAEEVVFRGFMFTGLQHSAAGPWGAILGTSLVWAAIHLQYEPFEMGWIFVFGIFLGWARLKTGSLPLCIILHALNNLISTIQMEYAIA